MAVADNSHNWHLNRQEYGIKKLKQNVRNNEM